MNTTCDIVIIGGAVMGSAIAYFLAGDSGFRGRITVLERDPGYGDCATTRSWGGIRQQFSTPENIRMSPWLREHIITDQRRMIGAHLAAPASQPRSAGWIRPAATTGTVVRSAKIRPLPKFMPSTTTASATTATGA